MKKNTFLLSIIAVVTFLTISAIGFAAAAQQPQDSNGADYLSYVPGEKEVVIYLNTGKLFASDLYKELKKEQGDSLDKKIAAIELITGINLERDLQGVLFSSILENKESEAVILIGTFDQARLINLVSLNAQYKKTDYNSRTYHTWFDDKENKLKSGIFFSANILAIGTESSIKSIIDAAADPSKSIANNAVIKDAAASADKGTILWAAASTSGSSNPKFLNNPILNKILSASAFFKIDQNISFDLAVNALNPTSAKSFKEIFEGITEVLRMHDNKPEFKNIAEKSSIGLKGNDVNVNITLSKDEGKQIISSFIKDKQQKK